MTSLPAPRVTSLPAPRPASDAARAAPGPGRESGWQLAQRVWQDSGVDWEAAAEADATARVADPYPADAFARYPADPQAGAYSPADYPDDLDADDLDPCDEDPGDQPVPPVPSFQPAPKPAAPRASDRRPAERERSAPGVFGQYGADWFAPGDAPVSPSRPGSPPANRPHSSDDPVAEPAGGLVRRALRPADQYPADPFAPDPDDPVLASHRSAPAPVRFAAAPVAIEVPLAPEVPPATDDWPGSVPADSRLTPVRPARPLTAVPPSAGPGPASPRRAAPEAADDFRPADQARGGFPDNRHQTRPGLPLVQLPGDSRLGVGPWPVQPQPSEPEPVPAENRAGAVSDRAISERAWPARPAEAAFASPRSFPPPSAPAGSVGTLAPPLSAPAAPAAPATAQPDELFRAWQGSVREATDRRTPWASRRPELPAPRRRGRGRQAARVGVPAAVIVTVGAGALLMLTGQANDMLAERANTAAPASSAAPAFSASLSPVSTVMPGYPGGHGGVGVLSMVTADGSTVAVGSADSHPAIWRRGADGIWALVSMTALLGAQGHLTSVARGPLGWVAVGSVAGRKAGEPFAYQSADGVTWTPLPALAALAGPAAQFLGVAAGPGGYLVTGRTGSGAQTAAARWWSGDLKNWGAAGGQSPAGSISTAVVALGNGFAAVGSELSCHTVWTSPDGQHWTAHDLTKPAGTHLATLRSVAASPAGTLVAAGFAVGSGGDIPLVVTSADGGAHLNQVLLSAPGGPATVTAVTATSGGFVAVGLAGPAGAQRAVTWTSPDGRTWSAATPVTAAGDSAITALASTSTPGGSPAITGTAQRGTTSALLTIRAP